MTTSPTTSLSKPSGSEKVSLGTLGYVRARVKQRAFDLVVREFKKSGLSQRELAARLGKTPDVVCRLLSRPSNWELNTFSDLMFGISGAVPVFESRHPLDAMAVTKQKTSSNVAIAVFVSGAPNQFRHPGRMAAH